MLRWIHSPPLSDPVDGNEAPAHATGGDQIADITCKNVWTAPQVKNDHGQPSALDFHHDLVNTYVKAFPASPFGSWVSAGDVTECHKNF